MLEQAPIYDFIKMTYDVAIDVNEMYGIEIQDTLDYLAQESLITFSWDYKVPSYEDVLQKALGM